MSNVKRKADDIGNFNPFWSQFEASKCHPTSPGGRQRKLQNKHTPPLRKKQWVGPGAKNNNLNKTII